MLRRLDSSRAVSTYAKSVVKRVHTQSKLEKIRVTLIEGPSYSGSHLAQVNAELGGASLRIVEPIDQKPRPEAREVLPATSQAKVGQMSRLAIGSFQR